MTGPRAGVFLLLTFSFPSSWRLVRVVLTIFTFPPGFSGCLRVLVGVGAGVCCLAGGLVASSGSAAGVCESKEVASVSTSVQKWAALCCACGEPLGAWLSGGGVACG